MESIILNDKLAITSSFLVHIYQKKTIPIPYLKYNVYLCTRHWPRQQPSLASHIIVLVAAVLGRSSVLVPAIYGCPYS